MNTFKKTTIQVIAGLAMALWVISLPTVADTTANTAVGLVYVILGLPLASICLAALKA